MGNGSTTWQPSVAQIKILLQKLLDMVDPQFHREKKELPVAAITVAKAGAITKSQRI